VDLLTVGEAFEDVVFAGLSRLPALGEELRVDSLSIHPGGGAVITAIAAARLGLRATVMTALSDANVARIRGERVSLINLRNAGERGAVSVALSTRRDRAFVTFEGVNRVLERRLLAALGRLARRPRHVHFALSPRRCSAWLPALAALRARRVTTSWDFGWNDALTRDRGLPTLIAAVDWVFVNEREAAMYGGVKNLRAATGRWRQLAARTAIKLGAAGAIVIADGLEWRRRPPQVRPIDTTGAGDAFNAGFIAALLRGRSHDDALRLGNYIGAQSTRRSGGIDGLPGRGQLPAWAARLVAAA